MPDEIEIDLREEGEHPADQPAEELDETAAAAVNDAKRRVDAAPGEDDIAKLANAINDAEQAIETHRGQRDQAENVLEQARVRVDQLKQTRERLEDLPDDCSVIQTVAGGISIEVPTESDDGFDRDDLLEDVDETIESESEKVERYEERLEGLDHSLERAELAKKILERKYDQERATDRVTDRLAQRLE